MLNFAKKWLSHSILNFISTSAKKNVQKNRKFK